MVTMVHLSTAISRVRKLGIDKLGTSVPHSLAETTGGRSQSPTLLAREATASIDRGQYLYAALLFADAANIHFEEGRILHAAGAMSKAGTALNNEGLASEAAMVKDAVAPIWLEAGHHDEYLRTQVHGGRYHIMAGEYAEGIPIIREAVGQLVAKNVPNEAALLLGRTISYCVRVGAAGQAIELERIAKDNIDGDEAAPIRACLNKAFGYIELDNGNIGRAVDHIKLSAKKLAEAGLEQMCYHELSRFGVRLIERGYFEAAVEVKLLAADKARENQDSSRECSELIDIRGIYTRLGESLKSAGIRIRLGTLFASLGDRYQWRKELMFALEDFTKSQKNSDSLKVEDARAIMGIIHDLESNGVEQGNTIGKGLITAAKVLISNSEGRKELLEEAVEILKKAASLYVDLNLFGKVGKALRMLGSTYHLIGVPREAMEYYQLSISAYEKDGDFANAQISREIAERNGLGEVSS